MYPNSALSPGLLALVAVVPFLCLVIWISAVFIAARPPRRASNVETVSLPQNPAATDEPAPKAA